MGRRKTFAPDLEQATRMAVRLQQDRDAMKAFWGAQYEKEVAPYREMVRGAMERFGCGPIEAPMRITKAARAEGHEVDGTTLAMLLAASIEETEQR